MSETIESEEFFRNNRQNMFSNYACGTIDQVLMAVLRVKYEPLRMFSLLNKVIILDEIHAYDTYMYESIKTLLQYCKELGIPVVMMSATLPKAKKEEMLRIYNEDVKVKLAYPQLTLAYADGAVKQHVIRKTYKKGEVVVKMTSGLNNPEKVAKLAYANVALGGCEAVIMNSVKEANEVYDELNKIAEKDTELYVFHARTITKWRRATQEKCEKNI